MVKFLIIRLSSIGDIVLTTPVIRCLKKQVEEAEIHFLTKAKYSSILEANPYIDKLHLLDNNLGSTISELKSENFDYIIDLHRNFRSLRVRSSLKIMSFTVDKINSQDLDSLRLVNDDVVHDVLCGLTQCEPMPRSPSRR